MTITNNYCLSSKICMCYNNDVLYCRYANKDQYLSIYTMSIPHPIATNEDHDPKPKNKKNRKAYENTNNDNKKQQANTSTSLPTNAKKATKYYNHNQGASPLPTTTPTLHYIDERGQERIHSPQPSQDPSLSPIIPISTAMPIPTTANPMGQPTHAYTYLQNSLQPMYSYSSLYPVSSANPSLMFSYPSNRSSNVYQMTSLFIPSQPTVVSSTGQSMYSYTNSKDNKSQNRTESSSASNLMGSEEEEERTIIKTDVEEKGPSQPILTNYINTHPLYSPAVSSLSNPMYPSTSYPMYMNPSPNMPMNIYTLYPNTSSYTAPIPEEPSSSVQQESRVEEEKGSKTISTIIPTTVVPITSMVPSSLGASTYYPSTIIPTMMPEVPPTNPANLPDPYHNQHMDKLYQQLGQELFNFHDYCRYCNDRKMEKFCYILKSIEVYCL